MSLEALYTKDYYLADCEGFAEFARTGGRKLSRRLRKCFALLDARPGETVLDLGCGRGELALHAAKAGAFTRHDEADRRAALARLEGWTGATEAQEEVQAAG